MTGIRQDAYANAHRIEVDCGDPWGPEAEALLAKMAKLGDHPVVSLTGDGSRGALLDRLALAERVRTELGFPVAVAWA